MILRCNSKNKQTDCLSHGGNRNKILNDIVQEADSTEKKALHKGIYKESCAYSTYIEEENINNKITQVIII